MYENSRLIIDSSNVPEPHSVTWRSPSNIAIIKYWGKYGVQLPKNPSLSLTLASSCTDMRLEYSFNENNPEGKIDLEFLFHQEENEAFRSKMLDYLNSLLPIYPFLKQLSLKIQSGNSFPHSAGIASSASSMSALALCLCSMEDNLFGTLKDPDAFDQKASYLARLASGSACRSIYPYAAVWGETTHVQDSSNEYAIGFADQLHSTFKDFHDDILIVSRSEKAVSSRAGHALMDVMPQPEPRYTQAKNRLTTLIGAMKTGDLETFGKIAEAEAMTLHALMMTSNPSFTLLRPDTLAIIEKLRQYRTETKNPVYFTLDAGPNVHLLYPGNIVHEVRAFIEEQLAEHCEDQYVQQDWVGEGPEEI